MSLQLFEKLKQDNIDSLKSGDKIKKSLLTTVIGEITTDFKRSKKQLSVVSDDMCISVINRYINGIKESATLTLGYNSIQLQQLNILNSYLPDKLSETEISDIIQDNSITTLQEAFSYFNKNYRHRFDATVIQKIFKKES